MKQEQKHIIHTLRYEMQFQNASANMQDATISKMHHEHFAGLLEDILNQYAPADKYLWGDSIEINLGHIPKDKITETFKLKLETALKEKLSFATEALPQPGDKQFNKDDEVPKGELKIISATQHDIHALLFFLENGYFNWQYTGTSKDRANKIFRDMLQKHADMLKSALSELFLTNTNAIQRFIYQIQPKLQIKYFELIDKDNAKIIGRIDTMPSYFHQIPGLSKYSINRFLSELKEILYTSLLLKEQHIAGRENPLKQKFEKLGNSFKELVTSRITEEFDVLSKNDIQPMLDKLTKIIADIRLFIEHKGLFPEAVMDKSTEKESQLHDDTKKEVLKDEITGSEERLAGEDPENTAFEKGLMAGNAGLVLLWPYLTNLFTACHLLEDGVLKDDDHRQYAIFLLNYLAGESGDASEDELLVPKILCGADMNTPLPASMELSETHLAECDQLLQATIKNWSALKATSVKGLQETFLRREAMVKKKMGNYEFHFERKGADILIDRLPYNISFISLKWLKYIIETSW